MGRCRSVARYRPRVGRPGGTERALEIPFIFIFEWLGVDFAGANRGESIDFTEHKYVGH